MTSRPYYIAHREDILAKRAARRAAHLEEERAQARARYRAQHARYRAGHVDYYRQRRAEMLAAYGHACDCCGVVESTFLTLVVAPAFHIRRQKDGKIDTFRALRDMRRAGWPQDAARLLCRNCLWGVRQRNGCPHQLRTATPHYSPKSARSRWLAGLRAELLRAYGGACACCGETTADFLTLDHVNGGGNAHRRLLRAHDNLQVLLHLRAARWPQDGTYRLLCWSCQWGTCQPNGCPHQVPGAHYAGAGRVGS